MPPEVSSGRRRSGGGEFWFYFLRLVVGAILVGGYLAYQARSEYREVMAYWEARQSSIADHAVQIVSRWLKERSADTHVLGEQPASQRA